MNNRVQQRFDKSIREAVAHVERLAERRHLESQAYAEDRERSRPPVVQRPRRPSRRLSQADQLRAYDAARGAEVSHAE